MTAFTDWAEAEVFDHFFHGTAIVAAPANQDVALYTTAPTDAGGGTEVSGGAYARQAVSTVAGWSGAGTGATDNVAVVAFPAATANLGTIVAMGLFVSTDLFMYGNLTVSRTVNDGDDYEFAAGALDASVD